MASDKPLAFVIMPFTEAFDAIWQRLIKPSLDTAGYSAVRGDTELGTANILRDIVRNITDSSLLVADLTGNNPNVFYELGLAHGLGVPTLLLTQSTQTLPFDLKGYRVLEYSTQFDQATLMTNALTQIGKDHLAGRITWSDPVQDYAPERPGRQASPSPPEELVEHMFDNATATLRELLQSVADFFEASEPTVTRIEELGKELDKLEDTSSSTTHAQAEARVEPLRGDLKAYLEQVHRMVERLRGLDQRIRDAGESFALVARSKPRGQRRESLIHVFLGLSSASSATIGWRNAMLGVNPYLVKFGQVDQAVESVVDGIITAHEFLIALLASAQAVLSRTALVLNESLSPTQDEIERLSTSDVPGPPEEGGEAV